MSISNKKLEDITSVLLKQDKNERTITTLTYLSQFETKNTLHIFSGEVHIIRAMAREILHSQDRATLKANLQSFIHLVEDFSMIRNVIHKLLERKEE